MRWPYLATEDYHVRQHIAEWYLRGMPRVVEIGPNGNGVTVPGEYHAIDRLSDAPQISGPYGLVYLGVDIEGGDSEVQAFRALVRGASVCVLETALDYEIGARQMREAAESSGKGIVARFEIYLPNHGKHSRRGLMILRGEE